jgi:hypothetical protein
MKVRCLSAMQDPIERASFAARAPSVSLCWQSLLGTTMLDILENAVENDAR